MVVNYRHINQVTETASTSAGGQVTFPQFAVQHDGHPGIRVTVSVSIGTGSQALACSASFIDYV
jgi:hypothetical protein